MWIKKAMKTIYTLIILGFFSFSFMPNKKIRIFFFGDSITEAGIKPHGFISLDDSILNRGNNPGYELIGAGVSGNKVYDLYLRLEEDVLTKSPDMVVIWVGVNDVWHKKMGTGTDADKFEKFYLALVRKFKEAQVKMVLCTPAVIGEKNDYSNEQDGDLNKYAKIIRKIAQDQQLTLVDLRSEFENYEKSSNSANLDKGILTADGVHLNDAGNLFVARLIAKGILQCEAAAPLPGNEH
jgi:lysophospholipase L1-like esterase